MPKVELDLEEFDDEYSEDEEVLEIPKAVRKISTQAYDKSVSDIVRMIEEGDSLSATYYNCGFPYCVHLP